MSRLTPGIIRLFCAGLLFAATGAGAQDLGDMQQQFLRGNYDQVIATAKKEVADNSYRSDWRELLVKSLLTVGRYGDAYTNAKAGLDNYSSSIGMRLLARETALFQNDLAGANQQLAEISLMIERRPPSVQDGEDLVALGQALLLLGVEPKLVLENCFQQAEKMDPPPRAAFLATGKLALDKHDFALAADAFRAGLKKFPDDPDLEAGLARAFETGNREEMLKAVEAALAINPRHVPSLLLLADHLIDGEQYDEAEKQLAIVLSVNPHQPEALAYRAVLANLQNNPAQEKKFRAEALKFWKTNPQVDYLIGYKLSQKYRFAEGAAAQKRALAFEPDYLPAREQLAEDLLRLGQSDEGWKLAEEVHKQDGYDVTAFNLVTLHDQMMKFQTLTNANFIVHMTPLEAGLYGDLVLEMLSRERELMTRKYGVKLTQPTVVDIFPEQKDFAVRTFGMPDNPGYLGVCFGSVITANSPASQAANPANWQDVLWHEFTHVITLTASKNKMPRWFSEGISVYEERQANPAWGEHMNLAYRDLILTGELTPLAKLSSAFLAPKDSLHLEFAYYESSLAIEFIVQRFGLESLKKILADLGDGKNINTAIPAHTIPLDDMEKQFAAYATGVAKNLAPGVDLDKPPAGGPDRDLAIWKAAHPDNYYVRFQNAEKLMEAKDWTNAEPVLESLATAYHGEKGADNPLWLLAVTQRNLDETNAELATLQKFALSESDFVDLYGRLIELSEAQKDWPSVTKYANRLLAINPLLSLPHRALAEAGVALGNNDQAITAYRKLLLLNPPDPVEAHFQLARLLHARGGSEAGTERQVLQALEDAPRFRDAQRLLLEIKDKNPQPTATPATSDTQVNPPPMPIAPAR
ncbi:MAG TPA: tetratricopeptide repeat protein [Verrucomicrobiae bacterium]